MIAERRGETFYGCFGGGVLCFVQVCMLGI